jgi:hypothetical protein
MVQTKASLVIVIAVALVFLISTCRSSSNQNNRSAGMMTDNRMMGGMMNDNRMMSGMPIWMMSGGMMDESMMRDMGPIHGLLMQHEKIHRAVEEIPGGVRTMTTSEDPQVTDLIRTHVREMKERIEKGQPIRQMDPLFREIFRHHEKIRLEIEDVPGGVRATETSDDPQVTLLIRQHAKRAVSEFVQGGMNRAMQGTPLPEGYKQQP